MKQFDKTNMDKEELLRHLRVVEKQVLDQERVITFLKVFALNPNVSLHGTTVPPSYQDDPADYPGGNMPGHFGSVANKVISLRVLEAATHDRFLNMQFNLYNAHVKLSIDHRLDLAERSAVQALRLENRELRDQLSFIQGELEL